jgi:hypothetical protein
MLELKKKTILIKYEGVEYTLRAPSNSELKEFVASEGEDLDKTIAFLDKLGLPSAIGWELDPESLMEVTEAITPKKKS